MTHFREGDYAYWTRPETVALAKELGITFIGYRELQMLQATLELEVSRDIEVHRHPA